MKKRRMVNPAVPMKIEFDSPQPPSKPAGRQTKAAPPPPVPVAGRPTARRRISAAEERIGSRAPDDGEDRRLIVQAREPTEMVSVVESAAAAAREPEVMPWLTRKARPKRSVFPAVGDGLKLREARLAAGMSQWDLARQIGVDQSRVSKWESARRMYQQSRDLVGQVFTIEWED
jgi:DNA-binding transcriptional regulator YiaG